MQNLSLRCSPSPSGQMPNPPSFTPYIENEKDRYGEAEDDIRPSQNPFLTFTFMAMELPISQPSIRIEHSKHPKHDTKTKN